MALRILKKFDELDIKEKILTGRRRNYPHDIEKTKGLNQQFQQDGEMIIMETEEEVEMRIMARK